MVCLMQEKFDAIINKKMATVLDKEQSSTKIFHALLERFKTDGVEHNLYIDLLFPLHL
jgi:hypothetical protein